MNRQSKVKICWSPAFAYAIGLIVTDGNLSPDGRHINMTSRDEEMVVNFRNALGLSNKIGRKSRGGSEDKKYFVVQFGDRNFYDFLLTLGLKPAKSKILDRLNIPKRYFPDFLRGCIDGDGNISVVRHPESQHPQLRMRLSSASILFLKWGKDVITQNVNIAGGWIYSSEMSRASTLTFGKTDSIKLLRYIYYAGVEYYLDRKYKIAKKFLGE